MHSYIAVMNCFGKYIRTAGTCELKGIRHYIDYSKASLTTMEKNKCKNATCYTYIWCILAVLIFYVHVFFFIMNKFTTIMVVK